MGVWLDLTSHCLGLGTRGAALKSQTSRQGATPPAYPRPHGLPSSPLPTASLPTPLPGNWCLFLACVGSLLSTAADGLCLAALMSSGWQTSALGALFLRACAYAYVWHGPFVCVCAHRETCACAFVCVR